MENKLELERLKTEIDELLDDKLSLVVKNIQQDIFITKLIEEINKFKKVINILNEYDVFVALIKSTKNSYEYNDKYSNSMRLPPYEYGFIKEFFL